MLQVIISPAKQMRVDADAFAPRGIPPFPERTARLVDELRRIEREQGPAGLKALWRVNDRLLAENVEALGHFQSIADAGQLADSARSRLATPAIFSYIGIQYRSMAPEVLGLDALDWLQRHLWVLSGLYGCVRPFDAVQPYRLEMGAALSLDGARNLYEFWGDGIARAICDAARRDDERTVGDDGARAAADGRDAGAQADDAAARTPVVVNLASMEYAKAVLPHLPADASTVTCIFGEELRGERPVQRATASKIARGSMVRWMAEHDVRDVRDLVHFDVGYALAPELSSERGRARTLVFMRR